jgi:polyhydroxyalkanoate synthesis regulator phasin
VPITGKLVADFSAFYDEVTKAVASLGNLEASGAKVAASVGNLESSLGGISSELLNMDAATDLAAKGFDFLKEAFDAVVLSSIEAGNSLYEMSLKTGASVENLSRLQYVASQTGLSLDTMGSLMGVMEKGLGASGAAADKTQGALSRLGLSMQTLKSERPDQAFIDIVSALEKVPGVADRAAIGAQLFGRGWKEAAGLASDNIKALMADADKLGIVTSTQTAAAAHVAAISFQALGQQFASVKSQIASAFMPALIGLSQNLSSVFKAAVDSANKSLGAMGGSGGFLSTVATAMGTGNAAIDAQTKLYEYLRDGIITFVRSAVEPAVTALSYLMVGFNAMKVLALSVESGYLGIAYALEQVVYWSNKAAAFTDPLNAKQYKADAATIGASMDSLYNKMAANDAAMLAAKKNEDDWADAGKKANAAIEAGLKVLATTHTDVAGTIADAAKRSEDAWSKTAQPIDFASSKAKGFDKTLQDLEAEIDEANNHNTSLTDKLKLFGQAAADASLKAKALGKDTTAGLEDLADAFNTAAIDKIFKKWDDETTKIIDKFVANWQKGEQKIADGTAKMLADDLKLYTEYSEKNDELGMTATELQLTRLQEQSDAATHALGIRTEQNAAWYDAAKKQIDDYYGHEQGVALKTADTIEERNRKAGILTKAELDQNAADAEADYTAMLASHKYTTAEMQAAWDRMIKAEIAASDSMATQVILDLGKIGAAMLNAFATGGSVSNAAKSGAVSLGQSIGTSLLKGPLESLGAKAGPAFASALGGLAGPLGGAAVSLGLQLGEKLWSHFFGTAGRDAVNAFEATKGGAAGLQAQLVAIGPAGEAAWQAIAGVKKNDAAGAQAAIAKATTLLDQEAQALTADESKYGLADALTTSNTAAQTLLDSFGRLVYAGKDTSAVVAGMSTDLNTWLGTALDAGVQIPAGMQPILDQLVAMGKLTDDNARKLLGLDTKLDGGTFDDITAAAGRYGIQLDALGPKVNQLNIEKQAAQLSSDWKLLTSDGEDTNAVMDAMKSKVQDVVTAAFKFGDSVPSSMKDMIDSMIAAGKITDDLGNKLTDDSQINWETPLTDQVDKLVTSIQSLVDTLTGGGSNSLSGALSKIGGTVVKPKIQPVYDDSGIPPAYSNPILSGGQSTSTLTAPAGGGGGGDITVNLNADGRQLAQVVVPNIPAVVTSKGLNR